MPVIDPRKPCRAPSGRRPARAAPACAEPASAGFAAVDALVALTLLSGTLILAIGAADSARRLALSALESRRAATLLQFAIETAPAAFGRSEGRQGALVWQVDVEAAGVEPPTSGMRACAYRAAAVNAETGRRYGLATIKLCGERDDR